MFFSLVVRHRFVVIAAFLAVTAFFAFQLPDLRMEPDTEAYVPMHHPARRFWRRAEEDFGLGREILVAIEASGPRGIFTPEVLSGIADLSAKLQALEGVEEGQVTSLAEAEAIVGTADGLEVVPFFSESPSTQTEADAIRERVYQNPMFLNRLVSRDGSIGVIIVTSQHFSGEDPLVIYERVASVVEGYSIEGCRLLLAGNVAVEAVFGTQMAEDLARLIPLALFVVVVVLFFCFRSISMGDLLWRSAAACILLVAWNVVGSRPLAPGPLVLAGLAMAMLTVRGVMLPCLVVVIAVTWTWGFQALLDLPIYIAGTLVPPLLLAIGCADGIHIIERYHENSEFGEDPGEIVVRTMEELWRPVVLTSVTTAAGFGALVAGRMTVYQVFGLTTSVGIVAAMFASLTVLPALLSLMPLPLRHLAGYSESLVPRILIRVGELTERYRVATVSAAILIVVLGLVSASRLRVDYSWVESLQEGTPVLEADRILRTRHGGTSPMNIIISAEQEGGIKDPALLAATDRVLEAMSSDPEVGDTRALSEYVKRMNQAMNEDRPDAYRIPDSRELVAQYLLLYSLSGDPEAFDDLVDYDYSRANLTVLLRSDRMVVLDDTFARVEGLLDRYVRPLGAKAEITGSAMMLKTVMDLVLTSQVYSLAAASLLVFVFMALLFRSARDALICMLPPLLTGIINFGGMGALGIPLGPMKAMISAIALGIGIDYSIHLMSRFRDVVAEGMAVEEAIVEAVRTTGRAILFNGIVVVMGFAVLGFSASPNNVDFGLMIASNMAVSCIAALILMPAVLAIIGYAQQDRARRVAAAVTDSDESTNFALAPELNKERRD